METWLSIFYVVCQIFSDIGSLRIVAPFGISFDAGTLIYPITFTLRDFIHKKTSKSFVLNLIICSAFINIVMAVYFYIVSSLPPDINVGLQSEFSIVLSPVWRITFASILAEIVSEFVDTEIYSKLKNKNMIKKIIFSNVVSIPIDTFIFCFISFYGNVSLTTLFYIIFSNVVLKMLVTIISVIPVISFKE